MQTNAHTDKQTDNKNPNQQNQEDGPTNKTDQQAHLDKLITSTTASFYVFAQSLSANMQSLKIVGRY